MFRSLNPCRVRAHVEYTKRNSKSGARGCTKGGGWEQEYEHEYDYESEYECAFRERPDRLRRLRRHVPYSEGGCQYCTDARDPSRIRHFPPRFEAGGGCSRPR